MPDVGRPSATDHDALHILPLAIIPLQTAGLKRARLVKTARLDSRVELFSDARTGSGQFAPCELYQVYDFDREPHPDVELIETLSALPSYDIFSLRIQLRRLGIAIENVAGLNLSASEKTRLSTYMQDFLKPLIVSIYGTKQNREVGLSDLTSLFRSPDTSRAKGNLIRLANDLDVDVTDIPYFIQEYGDAYLSLSYYQYCFDAIQPQLGELLETLDRIIETTPQNRCRSVSDPCSQVSYIKKNLEAAQLDFATVMGMFRARTKDMWEAITAEKFKHMQQLIRD